MHGRLKVRTTEEQKLIKQKEQQKKLAAYRQGMKQILSTRNPDHYDKISLQICSQLLSINPDIYTLWNFRKEAALIEIKKSTEVVDVNNEDIKTKGDFVESTEEASDVCDTKNKEDPTNKIKEDGLSSEDKEQKLVNFLENEIKLTEQCLLANPKSYGSWHHRYWILDHHPKPNWAKEFDLCTKYLTMDDRNFHCWDYRRLIINKVGITLTDELKFSTERLNINFSNYSSWHYRSTLRNLDEESIESELKLVQNAVFTDPMDSSAWFYFRWVLSNSAVTDTHREKLLEAFDQLLELEPDCKWILMAKCWLTGSLCLNDKNFKDTRIDCYKKLSLLDPMRKGQYLDYQSVDHTTSPSGGDI